MADSPPSMRPRRWRLRPRLLVANVIVLALVLLGVSYRDYFVPKRFAEVEKEQLFRSAELKPGPLRMVIEKNRIHTILTLLSEEADSPGQRAEREVAAEKGLTIQRVPMPGNGCGSDDDLDRAAAIIADTAQRPLLVHCAAGVNRTAAAYAAYRMKYEGWTPEQAIAEHDRFGWSIRENDALCRRLREYYDARIAPAASQQSND